LASKQSTDPTRIKVLEAVADLADEDRWISSRDVRDRTGLSQQLVLGYLEELEREGLVDLDHSNNGTPPKVLPTPQGLKALGRSPAPVSRPTPLSRRAAAPSDEEVDDLARRLYQRLEDHLLDLDRSQTEQLLRRVLSEVKARPQAPAEPRSERRERREPAPEPQGNILDQLEAELAAELESPQPDLASWAEQEPPELSAADAQLERELGQSALQDYQDLRWHERTQEFMDIWDRARRRNLGLLGTFFTSFRPRWKYPQWEDFNQARRAADARGASYEQWVKAQFLRLSQDGQVEVQPSDLHGDEALAAYQASLAPARRQADLGPAPFVGQAFDAGDPSHLSHAEAMLEQLAELAASVYGDDPRGPAILAVEAVKRGNLPLAALDLRPDWKAQVLECLSPSLAAPQAAPPRQAPAPAAPVFGPAGPDYGGHPPLII